MMVCASSEVQEDAVDKVCAFHGGKSFEAIGDDFQNLERHTSIVNADVLDAWFDPSPRVIEKLRRFLPFLLKSSPPVHAKGLVEAISRARGVPEECVLVGGGSSDLIFTGLPKLIGRGERAMILDPMYGEYRHVLDQVTGAELVRFSLEEGEDFRIDTHRLTDCVRRLRPRLVALVNPNSPTGQHWPKSEAIRFLEAIPETTLVLIDETYVEYVGTDESLESEACARQNVVVMKSMSKVYALSGLRVGYLVGAASMVRELAKWMPPWAVSLPAQVAASEALADSDYYQQRYCETHALRAELAADFARIPGTNVFPSRANFLLIRTRESAQATLEYLEQRGVYLRNCDSMGERMADRFLRIAVKSREQNRRIAVALAAACQSRSIARV